MSPSERPTVVSTTRSSGLARLEDSSQDLLSELNRRVEVERIKEILPELKDEVVMRILIANNWDIERSTDAALAYNSGNFTRRSIGGSTHGQGLSSSHRDRGVFARDEDPDAVDEAYHPRAQRGMPVLLAENFLSPPRFRMTIESFNDLYIDFSVLFHRSEERLGMGIAYAAGETDSSPDSEIAICELSTKSPQDVQKDNVNRTNKNTKKSMLAADAGLLVGDIVTGINNNFFSPGTDIQEVLNNLKEEGNFIMLHFRRYKVGDKSPHKPSMKGKGDNKNVATEENEEISPYHKCAQLLLEQNVISQERAQKVTESLAILKDRVLQWNTGVIAEKVRTNGSYENSLASRSSFNSKNRHRKPGHRRTSLDTNFDATIFDYTDFVNGGDGYNNMKGIQAEKAENMHGTATNINIVIPVQNLRPAISTRVIRAEERDNHVCYLIWVMDVKSGAEWIVRRRFSAFFEFRETLISIRKSIASLEFPPKRLSMAENASLLSERLYLLQKFLRKTCSLLCVNSLHPSTARVQQALQTFLDVDQRMDTIHILETEALNENFGINSNLQVYAHSVMQMSVMDRVYDGFIDTFLDAAEGDLSKQYTEDGARDVLHVVQNYMNNLHAVMFDGTVSDSCDIIKHIQNQVSSKWIQSIGNVVDEQVADSRGFRSGIPGTIVKTSSNDSGDVSLDSKGEKKVREKYAERVQIMNALDEDKAQELARSAFRRQVEIEILVACNSRLIAVLENGFQQSEDLLQEIMKSLYSNPQTFYGISITKISPTSWERIVVMLQKVRNKTLVHDRLKYFLSICLEIPALYEQEHPGNPEHLGADEFLPIFIYILVQARIPKLLALNEELQSLVDPDQKMGETGYYLATLEAAIGK